MKQSDHQLNQTDIHSTHSWNWNLLRLLHSSTVTLMCLGLHTEQFK